MSTRLVTPLRQRMINRKQIGPQHYAKRADL